MTLAKARVSSRSLTKVSGGRKRKSAWLPRAGSVAVTGGVKGALRGGVLVTGAPGVSRLDGQTEGEPAQGSQSQTQA